MYVEPVDYDLSKMWKMSQLIVLQARILRSLQGAGREYVYIVRMEPGGVGRLRRQLQLPSKEVCGKFTLNFQISIPTRAQALDS